jgi:preprotein translocase subunit SecE
MINPFKLFNQVKLEASKVTWPSRNETVSVTLVVLVMIAIAAVFFVIVDWAIYSVIGKLLGY